MEREKLNKAAEEDYYGSDYLAKGFRRAFEKGAEWLMQQPLSERLTEEEKERITGMYNNMESFRKCSTNPIMIGLFLSLQITVENIFGKDLFNDNPELLK